MADELFADSGPEGRNRDSAMFESQLRAFSGTLGWRVLDHNVDMYLADDQTDAGGVDLVVAYRDPQLRNQNIGWLLEGKRHDGPGRYTPQMMGVELQRLRRKVGSLEGKRRFTEHERIRPHVDRLVGGVLCHHSNNYDAERARRALDGASVSNFEMGTSPLRIAYLGPDTLNGLAEAFELTGEPTAYLWPVGVQREQCWADVCPPEQLSVGMIAYRVEAKNVLWLRDTLEHADIAGLVQLTRAWGVAFDQVVITELTPEKLARLRSAWDEAARLSEEDTGAGRLPRDIKALNLAHANMKEFDKRWPSAA